jgi:hypothetical protein
MARVVSCVLRIASILVSTNIRLALAAMIFLQAGVVILFIVDLIFVQRILRSVHKHSAWHPLFSAFFFFIYATIILTIIAIITVVVQTFYTLNPNIHSIDRDIILYGLTFFAAASFLPILLLAIGLSIPWSKPLDRFGVGKLRTKIILVLISSTLLCFGASYRAYTNWHSPVFRTDPLPATFGKGPFYVVYFTVEIIVLFMYAIFRVDRRFHIPNGAHGPGEYVADEENHIMPSKEKHLSERTSVGILEDEDGVHDSVSGSEAEFVDALENQSITDPKRGKKSMEAEYDNSNNKDTQRESLEQLPAYRFVAPQPVHPQSSTVAASLTPQRPISTFTSRPSRLSYRLSSTSHSRYPHHDENMPRLTVANNPRLDSVALKGSRRNKSHTPSLTLPKFDNGLGLDFEKQHFQSIQKRESLKQQRRSLRQGSVQRREHNMTPNEVQSWTQQSNAAKYKDKAVKDQPEPVSASTAEQQGPVQEALTALTGQKPLSSLPVQSSMQSPVESAQSPLSPTQRVSQMSSKDNRSSNGSMRPFSLPRLSFGPSTEGDSSFLSSFGMSSSNNKTKT